MLQKYKSASVFLTCTLHTYGNWFGFLLNTETSYILGYSNCRTECDALKQGD